jgi:hypothetical protein
MKLRTNSGGYAAAIVLGVVVSATFGCAAGAVDKSGFTFDGGGDASAGDAEHPTDGGIVQLDTGAATDATDANEDGASSDGATLSTDSGTAPTDSGSSSADASSMDSASMPSDSGASASDSGASDTGSGATDSGVLDTGTSTDSATPFPTAPTCDGTIGASEYEASYPSAGQTWYAQWDDTALYVAVANADLTEGMQLYIGGSTGSMTGPNFDGLAPALAFPASVMVYAKHGYQTVQTYGAGGWSAPASGLTCYKDASTSTAPNTREIVLPWSLMGGRPSSFSLLLYMKVKGTAGGGSDGLGTYAEAPVGSHTAGTATFSTYFLQASTGPSTIPGVFSSIR